MKSPEPRLAGPGPLLYKAPSKVGVWLSLVEHRVRDAGVAGSNPATPTISSRAYSGVTFELHHSLNRRPLSRRMLVAPLSPTTPLPVAVLIASDRWTKLSGLSLELSFGNLQHPSSEDPAIAPGGAGGERRVFCDRQGRQANGQGGGPGHA